MTEMKKVDEVGIPHGTSHDGLIANGETHMPTGSNGMHHSALPGEVLNPDVFTDADLVAAKNAVKSVYNKNNLQNCDVLARAIHEDAVVYLGDIQTSGVFNFDEETQAADGNVISVPRRGSGLRSEMDISRHRRGSKGDAPASRRMSGGDGQQETISIDRRVSGSTIDVSRRMSGGKIDITRKLTFGPTGGMSQSVGRDLNPSTYKKNPYSALSVSAPNAEADV